MQQPSLGKPLASMMRPLPRVWPTATIGTAAEEIRDSGLPAVGVTEGPYYVGIVTQESLAAALASGAEAEDPVSVAMNSSLPPLKPYATGQEALELFSSHGAGAVAVVDDDQRLMGVLTPADLWPKKDKPLAPERVGGMATPFGVYLTNGTLGAGAKGLALVTTGMTMFTVLIVAQIVAGYAIEFVPGTDVFRQGAAVVLFYALFGATFRLLPISGIHAAEHKVVHAIERGESLTRENVRRMPRVHPRCGTNLAAAVAVFTALGSLRKFIGFDNAMLVAIVGTLLLWRPVGSMVQYWVTTKEPSDRHLDMGIQSGEELLQRYASGQQGRRTVFGWIWNSGMLHVMGGALLMLGLAMFLNRVCHMTFIPVE